LTLAPARASQSYRHEAFLWNGRADFVDGLLPFIEEGVEAGEAVLVAATPEHGKWLSDGLGSTATQVRFVDITLLGRNPARIIPACQQFLHDWSGYGRPARAVGEPLWDGQRPDEVRESQLHEALMNVAIDPDMPFWVRCPYDAGHLDAEVLAEASRSHPALATTASYQGSHSYRGHDHAQTIFTDDLPPMDGPATVINVTQARLDAVAETVTLQAASGNLCSSQVVNLTHIVRRLAEESLTKGTRQLTVRTWDRPDVLVAEVADTTVTRDLLVGRRLPQAPGGDALWLANQTCDFVQIRSGEHGTTVRLHMRKHR
jgi:DcmR-like sensory protein